MKKFIKTVSPIIVILLIFALLFTLASCDANDVDESEAEEPTTEVKTDPPSENEKGKLTEKMRDEIKRAYFEKTYSEKGKETYNSPDQITLICYGVFDNAYCVILTRPGVDSMTVITEVTVGEYTFMFSSSNTMSVYCEGNFYSLTKAYENGILDDSEIEELYNYYTEIKWGKPDKDPVVTPCPWENESLPIPSEIKLDIQIARLKEVHGENYEAKGYIPEQVWVVCYGIFDNTYCIMTWEPGVGYVGDETIVEVGGYSFRFAVRNTIKVYCEGEFYSLNEVYENGILDDTELAELYTYYNEVHWGK